MFGALLAIHPHLVCLIQAKLAIAEMRNLQSSLEAEVTVGYRLPSPPKWDFHSLELLVPTML